MINPSLPNLGPTGKSKVVQIHPTRLCNLECLHCYSLSGPKQNETLDIALLENFLQEAAQEGYNYLAISGGEPLLYPALAQLLQHAQQQGFQTSLTTNGMFLSRKNLNKIGKLVDTIAISLDGIPESHNKMRASNFAFKKMESNLKNLRELQIPFGFIFTLTQYNLNELDWVAEFAVNQGAKLLQIHPLENAGRALEKLIGVPPDLIEKSFTFLESTRIHKLYQNSLHIQLDLVNRTLLKQNPERGYVGSFSSADINLLSEVVSPLIVEPDGAVTPLLYGLSREFSIGNLHNTKFSSLASQWRKQGLHRYLDLCQYVYQNETSQNTLPYFNWYEAMATAAANFKQ